MKKRTEIIGSVERIDYPNKGIIRTEEGPIKVACALPGQKIRCTVKKFRSGSGEGILREVIEPAPEETLSPCPHYGRCGGCLYQTYPYNKELEFKEGQVRRLIEPVLENQLNKYEFESIKPSPVCGGYRNKMEYTFGDEYKEGPLALGMHRRGSMYDIETVTSCNIVDPDYCRIIEATVSYFGERGVPYYHRVTHLGYLRHLLVRRTRAGEILVGLVTSGQVEILVDIIRQSGEREGAASTEKTVNITKTTDEADLLEEYTDKLLGLERGGILNGKICGIIHIINDSIADAVKADRIENLYGEPFITEELLGLKFKITTFSFFQTNTYGAEVLYSKVREYVDSLNLPADARIFDLYSGTGTIAQIIAGGQGISTVTGVEIVEEAVEAARENAARNGLDNCRFIAGDVFKVLDELPEKPDLIILDPPRDGIHPKAMPKILSYGVEHIIYVSCKTTSLARDLPEFMAAGYTVKRICPVDQFPRTGNIEVVVSLGKNFEKPKDYIQAGIDAEDYYRIKNSDKEE